MTQTKTASILKPLPEVNFPLCLAPMVGLSHVALRELCHEYLPEGAQTIWPTEMLNSRRLPNEKIGDTPETKKSIRDHGLVPQILGNEEHCISESVRLLQDWGAVGIDINMGCPVRKALQHNYGVSLMGDAAYAAEVVRMTKKNAHVPVSVKLRAGLQNDFSFLENFVTGLVGAGADWICLHPRTSEQMRRGRADWSQIEKLKSKISVPLIGNGDIQTLSDIEAMQESTGCDMVMSGRALAARPWLFWQLGERLGFAPPPGRANETVPSTPLEEGREYGRSLVSLLNKCEEHFGENLALRKFRFHVRTTHVWLQFGHALHAKVTSATTVAATRKTLYDFFEGPQEMVPRTDLRQ